MPLISHTRIDLYHNIHLKRTVQLYRFFNYYLLADILYFVFRLVVLYDPPTSHTHTHYTKHCSKR